MFQNLTEAKLAKEECIGLIEDYRVSVNKSKDFRYEKGTIYVDYVIEDELNLLFKDFL